MQKTLSPGQIEAFYHDEFVEDQARDFVLMMKRYKELSQVVDVGGGCGFFARRLNQEPPYKVKVMDMDPTSVAACHAAGIQADIGDALAPKFSGNEQVASFNLILHHLIATTETGTLALQSKALTSWRGHAQLIFVNEYIYQSYLANLSGWLIFQITKNSVLSWLGKQVARVIPSFKANTFGVGVRFRSNSEWKAIFDHAGFSVVAETIGKSERVALPLRLLLIQTIRRDSFLLAAKAP